MTPICDLFAPAHVQHDEVHGRFGRTGRRSFGTCPIRGNGLLRIVGHPKYPSSPGPPSTVTGALASLRGLPGHMFWADSISLLDPDLVDASLLSNRARVTDSYLLALARANSGQLATLHRKLAAEAVADGGASLKLI